MELYVNNKELTLYSSVIYLSKKRCFLRVEFQREYNNNQTEFLATVYECAHAFRNFEEKNYLSFKSHSHVIGIFSVSVHHSNQSIRLGPEGELGMLSHDYQGQSIGRFCISKLLVLAAADVTPFKVLRGKLSLQDAKTLKAKNNRNNFYKKLGLTLKLDSDEQIGSFFCNDSSQLTLGWNSGKLREINTSKFLRLYEKTYKLNKQINSLKSAYERKDESMMNSWNENRRLKICLASFFILMLFLVAALLETLIFIE